MTTQYFVICFTGKEKVKIAWHKEQHFKLSLNEKFLLQLNIFYYWW